MAAPNDPPGQLALEAAPLLERLGVAYLRRLALGRPAPVATDAVHILNPVEQAALRRIERGVVLRAAAAGACSALAVAAAEVVVRSGSAAPPTGAGWSTLLLPWLVVGLVATAAATIEILFVYRDALRAVHRLSETAGLDPLEAPPVAAALVRAALEMPNPLRPTLGVDPCREVSKTRLLLASLAYKAKVGLTNFLVKALVRRILGRAAVRVWLAFAAVPVSACWNAMVAFRVIREARVRVMGPSFVQEVTRAIFDGDALSPAARRAALRAVAGAIVRSHDLHPNLIALLHAVGSRMDEAPPPDLDDTGAFVASLRDLDAGEPASVLDLLAAAAVVDGRLTAAEKRLLREARAACGLGADLSDLRRLHRAFLSGQRRPEALAGPPGAVAARPPADGGCA